MPLLVIPVGSDETERVTLKEWDALTSRERVLFERPDHPLVARLRRAGISAGPFDDEPDPAWDAWALVVDPDSPRLTDLVEAGAEIVLGAADPPDPLAAARGAYVSRRAERAFATLISVMARLRGPGGCPWDAEQTHPSLQVHLVEETYEVVEAIENGDLGSELEEELGDVLLQVVFHAQMAADDGRFDIATLTEVLVAKLIRRHPHVFGDVDVSNAADVVRNWEEIKGAEKDGARGEDRFGSVPRGLPALLAAYKTQKKAAKLGFNVDADEARERLRVAASDPHPDVGAMLFWCVALARAEGADPEAALRAELARFRGSF